MLDELAERRDERERWRYKAACRGMGWDAWFPVRGQGRPRRDAEASPAHQVCAECPVTAECQAFAEKLSLVIQVEGIWGGVEYRRGVPIADYYRKRSGG